MVRGFALLLFCQLMGEAASRALALPVPGPVLGLVLLLLGLHLFRTNPAQAGPGDLENVADGLLANLGLLFVPAGAGVVKHLGLLAQHGLAIGAALVGSTALTLVVTVFVFGGVARLVRQHQP